MTHLEEFRDESFTWPKGATYWGEPLPYVQTVGGKRMIAYGDWWTDSRIEHLSAWSGDAIRALILVCGSDKELRARASSSVGIERLKTLEAIAGKGLNMRRLFAEWVPTAEEAARIDERVERYTTTRESVRSSLLEACSHSSDLSEELPGEPSSWSPPLMAFAVVRLPRLLLSLVAEGLVPDPGAIVPQEAKA